MSSAAINNKLCPACAAEIRDQAVFCFNCGQSFEDLVVIEEPAESRLAEAEAPASKGSETGGADSKEKRPVKVRRAADGARRPARLPRRELEIEWTAPEEGPGAAFVLGAAAVGALSLLVFLIAVYLK